MLPEMLPDMISFAQRSFSADSSAATSSHEPTPLNMTYICTQAAIVNMPIFMVKNVGRNTAFQIRTHVGRPFVSWTWLSRRLFMRDVKFLSSSIT